MTGNPRKVIGEFMSGDLKDQSGSPEDKYRVRAESDATSEKRDAGSRTLGLSSRSYY